MHGRTGAWEIERVGGSMTVRVALLMVLAVWPSGRLAAQDTTATDSTRMVLPSDTMHRGVGPMGAFWRSFLIPGWGQAVTGRTTTGAAFVAWEGVTAMMTLKAQQEVNYFRSIHSANLELKKQEVQDWAVLWVFNHLF